MSTDGADSSLRHRVEPEYPDAARQQNIQGSVVLEVHIGAMAWCRMFGSREWAAAAGTGRFGRRETVEIEARLACVDLEHSMARLESRALSTTPLDQTRIGV